MGDPQANSVFERSAVEEPLVDDACAAADGSVHDERR